MIVLFKFCLIKEALMVKVKTGKIGVAVHIVHDAKSREVAETIIDIDCIGWSLKKILKYLREQYGDSSMPEGRVSAYLLSGDKEKTFYPPGQFSYRAQAGDELYIIPSNQDAVYFFTGMHCRII